MDADTNPFVGIGIPKNDLSAILRAKGPDNFRTVLKDYCRKLSLVVHPDYSGIDSEYQRRLNSLLEFLSSKEYMPKVQEFIQNLASDSAYQQDDQTAAAYQKQINELNERYAQARQQIKSIERKKDDVIGSAKEFEKRYEAAQSKHQCIDDQIGYIDKFVNGLELNHGVIIENNKTRIDKNEYERYASDERIRISGRRAFLDDKIENFEIFRSNKVGYAILIVGGIVFGVFGRQVHVYPESVGIFFRDIVYCIDKVFSR
ncbi:MAG TPA: hypothetical protein VJI75_06500 [Candidatus Nanoarchaeia archaeon]|nr:hypothetical protein [Candidatus Nanoarchaeia archaeon]